MFRGTINISQQTYELVKRQFNAACTEIVVKMPVI